MFATHAFAALLALAAPLIVRADVDPLTPAPGDSFNAGTSCTTTWSGDTTSTTAWKNMAIELMTGDNLNMVHLTTVATGQDGTTAGSFQFTCPQVTINSAIYFYQYTAPLAVNHTWTTRFAIASSTGQTTPPPNPTQPESGDPIPWGVGALVDPSTAVPAPNFAVSGSSSASGSTPASGSTSAVVPATSASSTPVSATSKSSSSSSSVTSAPTTSSAAPSATPTTKSTTSTSGGSVVSFDSRVWMSAAALGFAALLW